MSQGIYMHHSNPIVLKLPCAKFHASSCSQTKVKVGGGGGGAPHPKTRFKKLTRDRVKELYSQIKKRVWAQKWKYLFWVLAG